MLDIQIDDSGRVTLAGRFDAAEADQALVTFRTLNRPLTVDCSGLEYISSAGIAVLVDTWKRLNGAGHTLTLVALQPRVRNVFAYAGLDRLLKIE